LVHVLGEAEARQVKDSQHLREDASENEKMEDSISHTY
jgi:hypothetical protein